MLYPPAMRQILRLHTLNEISAPELDEFTQATLSLLNNLNYHLSMRTLLLLVGKLDSRH
jgi:hypothetical protein